MAIMSVVIDEILMIQKVILSMIEYFGSDVLRINHALKVHGFASTISRTEVEDPKKIAIVEIAAVLHDIGIPQAEIKYNSSSGKYQEIEGPPIAREILTKMNLDNDMIERVCFLIGNHHSYTKIDGIDFQILIEADFLVNIVEDDMNNTMQQSIKQKYFKTKTGTSILNQMHFTP